MFRPCIDLHEGKVKQIVGGSWSEDPAALRTNFVSERPAHWFAELYRRDDLRGGHVIMLGPGNERAAREALAAFPAPQTPAAIGLSAAFRDLDLSLRRFGAAKPLEKAPAPKS